MKGTDCRMNLIKLTNCLAKHAHKDAGRSIYNMLLSLVELQKLAYALESDRSPRSILRAYNQSFVFALSHITLFGSHDHKKGMYGMPFHSIATHLAEMLRIVSGRAIVAEQAERHFNTLR